MSKKSWSKEEEEKLRKLYPDHTQKEIAEILGRTTASVNGKIYLMGLSKNLNKGREKSKKKETSNKSEETDFGKMDKTQREEYLNELGVQSKTIEENKNKGSGVSIIEKGSKSNSLWEQEKQQSKERRTF